MRQLLLKGWGGKRLTTFSTPSATPTDIFFESAEGRPITDCGLAENSWMLSRLQSFLRGLRPLVYLHCSLGQRTIRSSGRTPIRDRR